MKILKYEQIQGQLRGSGRCGVTVMIKEQRIIAAGSGKIQFGQGRQLRLRAFFDLFAQTRGLQKRLLRMEQPETFPPVSQIAACGLWKIFAAPRARLRRF